MAGFAIPDIAMRVQIEATINISRLPSQVDSFPRNGGGTTTGVAPGRDGGVFATGIAPIPTFPRRREKESTRIAFKQRRFEIGPA